MIQLYSKKVRIFGVVLFVAICAFGFYNYYFRPISLNDILGKETIQSINISTNVSPNFDIKLPNEIKIDQKQDINEVMSILNKYKYSLHLKWFTTNSVPANPTNATIHLYINLSNSKNTVKEKYLFVDSENDVIIKNKDGVNINYNIVGTDKKLFEDLSDWLQLR